MKSDTYRVPMRPHGLIFGGIEAYHLQDAFGSVPGPPGPQKWAKNGKKGSKTSKTSFFRVFLLTGTSLKGVYHRFLDHPALDACWWLGFLTAD